MPTTVNKQSAPARTSMNGTGLTICRWTLMVNAIAKTTLELPSGNWDLYEQACTNIEIDSTVNASISVKRRRDHEAQQHFGGLD